MAAKKTKAAAAKEVKEETTVAAAETTEEVKEEVKAAAPKKTAAKKKAKEPKVNVVVEYLDKNVTVDDLVEAAKEDYKARGNEDAIETIDVYYQPEYNKVYYVVNGKAQEEPVSV